MTEKRQTPDPLPPEWLPEPAGPPADDPEWDALARNIVEAAEPRLRRLRERPQARPAERDLPWWSEVERWLRPAAALAAAAVLLAVLVGPRAPEAESPAGSAVLETVAADGDPSALWRAGGSDAHPVLALVALEEEAP